MEFTKPNQPIIDEYRFEFTVEGMTCIKCTQKVEGLLKESSVPIRNIKVDFISNRVLLTVNEKNHVEIALERLQASGFKVKGYKDISSSQASDRRTITLKLIKGEKETIRNVLYGGENPLLDEEPRFHGNKCMISYNPVHIRGTEIVKKLKELPEIVFTIENCFEEDVDSIKFSHFTKKQLLTIVSINLLNVAISFLPEDYMYVPKEFGMFSYYFITVLFLTILNLKIVGFEVYATCFRQLTTTFNINMLTLVAIGSGLALIFGFVYTGLGLMNSIVSGHAHMFIMNACHMFHTSATIFTSLVVGKYIEGRIKKRIYSRIDDLKKKLQVKIDSVQRIEPKNKRFDALFVEYVAPMLIEKDDYIIIKNQGMIPFDGFIEKGTLKVVENIQYGWEKAESKTKGHPIISGSQIIDVQDQVIIRVTEPLEKTLAGRLFYEIKEAASGSSTDANGSGDILANITKYFISVVLLASLMTLVGWSLAMYLNATNETEFSYPFEKAIAVLVASCPCALGIAIPMVYAIALRKGFKAGVLIKDTACLDKLLDINIGIFDKTGTITGTYNIKDVKFLGNKYDEASLWEMVSLLEKDHLQHPVGLALFQESLQRLSSLEKPKYTVHRNEATKDLHEYFASEGIIEKGVSLNENLIPVALGNKKLLDRLKISYAADVPESHVALDLAHQADTSEKQEIKLYLCVENEVQLRITLNLQENLRSNALQVMSQLREKNKDIQILSGDTRANAEQIGQSLGIPPQNIFADIDPDGKERHIRSLVEVHRKNVMMVGDGINDIKAFKAATLSCSINFKSSQNLTYADFIVINNDLETISGLFNLAEVAALFKKGILICALLYNVPVILAASGIFKELYGIDLAAYLACWTMVLFSLVLTVIANLMEFVNIKKPWTQNARFFKMIRSIFSSRKNLKAGYGKAFEEDYSKELETKDSPSSSQGSAA